MPATPVTMPVAEPMVASVVIELLHMPPVVASFNVTVELTQTLFAPVIVPGVGLMVIACVPVINGDAHVGVTTQLTTQK